MITASFSFILKSFSLLASSIRYICIFFCFLFALNVHGQTIPVSGMQLYQYLRIKQLQGQADSNLSLNIRPVSSHQIFSGGDSLDSQIAMGNLAEKNPVFFMQALPIGLTQQYNTHHPYGWNDGLMISSKGYQLLASAGVLMRYGPLSIQLNPEFVFAANPSYFDASDQVASDNYLSYLFGADLPNYHKKASYNEAGMGQSYVKLNAGPVALGISNESLWWGPGRKNALVMANTARGFKHISVNTTRPIFTGIGHFEGQIIGGRLENSDSPLNITKVQEWRYLSGMVFSYKPKWVPHLSLGLTRAFQMYHSDVKEAGDYFPLFQPFEKKNTTEDSKIRDQLSSLFARLLLPGAATEIYVEFGRNDHSVDLRDFTMEPEHSRGYIAGFQKLISLKNPQKKLLIAGEITQLSQPPSRLVRNAGTWYTHSPIRAGYTNDGEVIGSGIGPGGNIQTLEISKLAGYNKIGLQIERLVHNNDYYQYITKERSNLTGQWVDMSLGLLCNWNYKNLIFNGELLGIQSYNYLWQAGIYESKKNTFNMHANIGLLYYFK